MLKPRSLVACLAVAVATVLGGCATASRAPGGQTLAASNPDCVQSTGSRINNPDRKCVNVPGSSYTQEDVQRTGEIDLGAALKRMDPRFQ